MAGEVARGAGEAAGTCRGGAGQPAERRRGRLQQGRATGHRLPPRLLENVVRPVRRRLASGGRIAPCRLRQA